MAIRVELTGVEKMAKVSDQMLRAKDVLRRNVEQASNDMGNLVVANIRKNYLGGPRPHKLDQDTGRLTTSIKFRLDKGAKHVSIIYGTDVPYARIHEFGGEIKVTKRMRGRFWHLFREKGELKYKYMALTRKNKFVMKKRSFLRPGLEDKIPWFKTKLERIMEQAVTFGEQ